MSGHAEQDCRDRIGGRGSGAEAQQQGERRMGIELVGERQQHRGAGDSADAGQQAEAEPHADAGEQVDQPMRIEDDQQGLSGRMQHIHFHGRASRAPAAGSSLTVAPV
jgi:hypothetical protein